MLNEQLTTFEAGRRLFYKRHQGKWIILLLVLIQFFHNTLSAQTLSQDSQGSSSVLYHGGSIGFDIAQTNITFSYTNLGLTPEADISAKARSVWGLNAHGRNHEGLAGIFRQGDLQPEAGFGGFWGLKYRFDEKPRSLSDLQNQISMLRADRTAVRNQMEALAGKEDPESIARLEKLRMRHKDLDDQIQEINDAREKINEQRVRKLGLVYLRGGVNASAFRLALENQDPASFTKAFRHQDFKGGYLGAGINYESGRWLYGLAIDYEFTNNLELLASQSFTLTTTEVIGNRALESKREFNAWTGNYTTYSRAGYSIDVIRFSLINEQEENYVALNFYLRHKFADSGDIMPSVTDIGTGAWFFNMSNKFLGGIYLEVPDLFRSIEGMKTEPDSRILQNRLSFGLVGRFNFASIFRPGFI